MKPFKEIRINITIELPLSNYKKIELNIEKNTENIEKIKVLTNRETEILLVLAYGKTSKTTGGVLNITSFNAENI